MENPEHMTRKVSNPIMERRR